MLYIAFFHFDFATIVNAFHHFMHTMASSGAVSG